MIGHGQVDAPVAGEVARDDRIRAARHRDRRQALERPVAVAQEDGDLVETRVGDGQVGAAVVVEVGRHDRRRRRSPCGKATVKGCWNVPSPLPGRMVTLSEPWLTTARPRLPLPVKSPVATAAVVMPTSVGGRFLEGAVAFAQEHGDVGGADVSRGQVEAAVAVEIARDDDRSRSTRRAAASIRRVDRGLKRPVAVAQEHRDIVGVGVGDGQVEMAVAEVARHDRGGIRPDRQSDDG